jgi:CheY-like chemotaxis protein
MPRFLIVDDDDAVRKNLSELLKSAGYSVTAASSGKEALELFSKDKYDIVFLDIVMPNLHGIDVLRKIRENNKDQPVVMLVSEKEKFLSSRALSLGAFDLLMKPVQKELLFGIINKINETLEKARTREQSFDVIRALEFGAKKISELAKGNLNIDALLQHTEFLQTTVDLIAEVLNVEKVSLMLINRETQELRPAVAHGYDITVARDEVKKVGEGIAGWVAEKGEPLIVKDIATDPRFKKSSFGERYRSGSFISAPLKVFGETVGVISVNDKKDNRPFDEHDLTVLNTFSSHISLNLERSHANAELKKYTEKLSLVNDSLKILITEVDPHSTFVELLKLAHDVLEAEGVALYFKEEGNDNFYMECGITTKGALTARTVLPRGKSICFAVVEKGKPMISNGVADEPLFNEKVDGLTDIHVKSLIVLPVKMKEYVVGLLKVVNKRGEGKFSKEDIEIVESIGYSILIATKIAWLHDNLIKSIDELARAETEIDVLKESAQRIK